MLIIDIASISNKTNKSLNEVWGQIDTIDERQNPGLIKLSIRANEQNQKIIGKANDFFYDDEIIDNDICSTKNKKIKEILHGGIPNFIKYNLSINIILGEFAMIPNLTNIKAFRFKVYYNPTDYQESQVLNERTSNWKKEILFQIILPCFIERIIVEIYSDE